MLRTDGSGPGAHDVIVVGGGHNGLVCATLLARSGRDVVVLERAEVLGGACRTEQPFRRAPDLRASTGAYLLGLMPPELLELLDLELTLHRRDPHYFLPTLDGDHLLLGADSEANRAALTRFFSAQDADANDRLQDELAALRDDLADTWLRPPLSIEATADRFVRADLRAAFVALCRGSVGAYLGRFDFASPLIQAMYAVTDGFSGLYGGWDSPGTGMNFLVHNLGRLPGADGTWMIVEGGMGAVTQQLADHARDAGADLRTSAEVASIVADSDGVRGVRLAGGEQLRATTVVVNTDPHTLRRLVPDGALGSALETRMDTWATRPGSTLKVNLALRDLPDYRCLPERVGQHGATTHLLPTEPDPINALRHAFAEVAAGRIAAEPTIEVYGHTAVDGSLRDAEGHHNLALFVQWVPWQPAGSSWDHELDGYVDHLLGIVERYAPGVRELIVDVDALPPPEIARRFGISNGHIHHVDNGWGFDERLPYALAVPGLYACGAGCHPAGSVIGAAGHNAARLITG